MTHYALYEIHRISDNHVVKYVVLQRAFKVQCKFSAKTIFGLRASRELWFIREHPYHRYQQQELMQYAQYYFQERHDMTFQTVICWNAATYFNKSYAKVSRLWFISKRRSSCMLGWFLIFLYLQIETNDQAFLSKINRRNNLLKYLNTKIYNK